MWIEKLHVVWFQLYDVLKKVSLQRQRKVEWYLGTEHVKPSEYKGTAGKFQACQNHSLSWLWWWIHNSVTSSKPAELYTIVNPYWMHFGKMQKPIIAKGLYSFIPLRNCCKRYFIKEPFQILSIRYGKEWVSHRVRSLLQTTEGIWGEDVHVFLSTHSK